MTPEETLAHQTATYRYAGALVDELAHAGVRHACVCPGSRSTPLAYTLAAHPDIKTWVHVDERSGSFFALGLAKALREPVVLVCTSGTAAANFLPAVVEARYGRVLLIVLTADRPAELRDNGAPQAIDQLHLYGRHAKWFVEMALPEDSDAARRYARATAARAAATAREGPAGPVHLNMPFREPLTPPLSRVAGVGDDHDIGIGKARRGQQGGVEVACGVRRARHEDLALLIEDLVTEPVGLRGLIVCGPQSDPSFAPAVVRLAKALGYPVLADPLSGVRSGHHDRGLVCDTYDAMLRTLTDGHTTELIPDVVLRFGAIPTSKALLAFLSRARYQVLVDGDGGWQDPSASVDRIIHTDAALLCTELAASIEQAPTYTPEAREPVYVPNREWTEKWHTADRRAAGAIAAYLAHLGEPFEGKVLAELAWLLPDGATLYAGNSMPVRDLDTFYPAVDRRVRFLCNRGANGIDGVVSSALGTAASRPDANGDGPLVLVIGDLSFYHDLNGLLAAKRYPIDATIILLNNDGGGIFSFLPQAANPERFEELFGTPIGLGFKPIVEAYGCGFERVESWPEFRRAVGASLTAPGVQVIELRTNRERNVALHREVWRRVAEAVWPE